MARTGEQPVNGSVARSMLGIVLFSALIGTGYAFYVKLGAYSILSVRIAGEFNQVPKRQLENAVTARLPASFFSVDVSSVRDAALAIPWVKEATVRRVWPDSLHIAVIEREAVARWGERELLERDGTLFEPHGGVPSKPELILHGPPETQMEVLTRYAQLEPVFAGVCGGLQSLSLDVRGLWRARLNCGPELVLGKRPKDEALNALAHTLTEVFGTRTEDIERIDLRYANGFAVRWKVPLGSELDG